MTIGELIGHLAEYLYGLWPIRIVTDWEQGVRIRHGNAKSLLTSTNGLFGTGLHVFWPIIGEIMTEDTNIKTPETDRQDMVTADGKLVSCSMAVRYRVRDLRALYLKIHDQEDTVLEEVRAAVAEVAQEQSFNVVMGPTFGGIVVERLKQHTRGWGLDILRVAPVNRTDAQQIRLILDDFSR